MTSDYRLSHLGQDQPSKYSMYPPVEGVFDSTDKNFNLFFMLTNSGHT